jgi:hypothetical protein
MKKEKVGQGGSMTASEMGRKRWARVSSEERKEALAKARAHINLSPEERSQIARNAIQARWEKWRAEHPESSATPKGEAEAQVSRQSKPKHARAAKQTTKPMADKKR